MLSFAKFLSSRLETLIIACFVLGVASLAGHDYVLKKNSEATAILAHYSSAISSSRSFLQAFFQELAHDPSLGENLSANYRNALEKALLTKLRKGQIDHLEVFDEHCTSLVGVSLSGVSAPPCPQGGTSVFRVSAPPSADQPPLLALYSRETLSSGQTVWLLGQVLLTSEWLALFPSLRGDFSHAGLSLTAQAEKAPFQLINGSNEENSLWTSERFLGWSLRFASSPYFPYFKSLVFWPLMAMTCLLLLLLWFGDKRQLYKQRRVWQQFTERVESLFRNEGLAYNYVPHHDPQLGGYPPALLSMQRLQKEILGAQQRFKEEQTLVGDLREKLGSYGQQEENWKRDLQQLACFEGLALQVQASAPALVEELGKEAEQFNEIVLTVKQDVMHSCREIMVLSENWQSNLQSQGSRKFIRSLCEQKNPDSPYPNLLEEQLAELLARLQTLLDQGLFLCTSLGLYEQNLAGKKQILQRWYRIAQEGQDTTSSTQGAELLALLEQSLALRDKDSGVVHFGISNLASCAALKEMPIPEATLASTLHHLFQAIASALPQEVRFCQLALRIKESKNERFLLLSCSEGDVYHDQQRRQEMWNSISKVNLLLAPYQMVFSLLPSPHNLTVFALRWHLRELVAPVRDLGDLGDTHQNLY